MRDLTFYILRKDSFINLILSFILIGQNGVSEIVSTF